MYGIVLYFEADSGQAGMTTFVGMTLIGLLNRIDNRFINIGKSVGGQ